MQPYSLHCLKFYINFKGLWSRFGHRKTPNLFCPCFSSSANSHLLSLQQDIYVDRGCVCVCGRQIELAFVRQSH
jgi:hypothetical protein